MTAHQPDYHASHLIDKHKLGFESRRKEQVHVGIAVFEKLIEDKSPMIPTLSLYWSI